MDIKNVVVAGGGVLGSQIAFQAAYCGFNVTIWLRSEASVKRCEPKIDNLHKVYLETIEEMASLKEPNPAIWASGISDFETFNKEECIKKTEEAYKNLKLSTDLKEALKDCDLLVESMAEFADQKIEFYKKVAPYLNKNALILSNSSTLLPSQFAKYTGNPSHFLTLHFANHIWKNNVTEVMGHDKTSKESFDKAFEFAKAIRMFPLPVLKEKNGYLLNSLLVPFLLSGLDLFVNGVSDPASIDKAWTTGTGAPQGPFRIFDIVGLQTAYNIVIQYQKVPGIISPLLKKMMMPYNFKGMEKLLKKYLDEGKTGVASGEGFYKYK